MYQIFSNNFSLQWIIDNKKLLLKMCHTKELSTLHIKSGMYINILKSMLYNIEKHVYILLH